MIDITPLDVRNKRGDFRKLLRGYDPQEVDTFLELVAERLEQLVRETLQLRERTEALQQQVSSQTNREQAVHEALVTAQELRADIQGQAKREAEHALAQAEAEARRVVAEAEAEARARLRETERRLEQGHDALAELERRRTRFLKAFRQLLERELDGVEVEEERLPLEERPIELDLGAKRRGTRTRGSEGSLPSTPPLGTADAPATVSSEHDAMDALDEESAALPPLDVPVDELAAAFERKKEPGAASGRGRRSDDETLMLSLDADDAESDDRWG